MEQIVTAGSADQNGARAGGTPVRTTTTVGRIVIALDRVIIRIARRWLFLTNSLFFAQVVAILLAPALTSWGQHGVARPIYAFNGLFCHQQDDRSFHLLGEKMACCQRCAAIYASMLLFGLVFSLIRGRLGRPRLGELALLAAPAVVDGGAQLAGLWESSAASRVLSGTLLGAAICWFLLPYLDAGFARIRTQIETLFAKLVAEGRARPL